MKQSKFNPILSPTEKRNLLTQTEFIIDNLDAQGIDQLLSGYSGDEAKLLDLIQEEITNVFSFDEKLSGVALQNMNELSASMDEYLKRFNYNYFKTTMLPNFTQWVFNLEWGNYVQMYPKLGIKASRGLGKTYEFDYALPLWHLYRYRKNSSIRKESLDIRMSREGVSISNEFSLVKRILRGIREEIENNDLLRDKLFPGKGSGRWGDTEIQTKTGSSWTIRSYGSAIRGLHVGRVIVDDFLDNSCLYSLEQNNKFKEVFNAEIMNILEKAGSIVVVGTPFTQTDLYADLEKDKKWKWFEYPGIMPDGTITNPFRFNYQYYKDLKQQLGTPVFSREILCVPISDQASIFPYSILTKAFIGMGDICMVDRIEEYPIAFKKVSVGCDFSISGSVSADFTVFTVVGIDNLDQYHVIHQYRAKGATHYEQIAAMQKIKVNFHPDVFLCEANNFQRVMIDLAKEAGISNTQPYVTTGWNKKDLRSGLPSLAALFEMGRIRLPRGDEKSIAITDSICAEFNSITFNADNGKLESTNGHDDQSLSIFFAAKGMDMIHSQLNINYL